MINNLKNLKDKIYSSKINYFIFAIVVVVMLKVIISDILAIVAFVYFITNSSFVKSRLHKLKNKQVASVAFIVLVLVIFGGAFAFSEFVSYMVSKKMAEYVPQPTVSTSETVKESSWENVFNTIGQISALQETEISSQSGGIVTKINFTSGEDVKKGDLLFELDTSQLKAELKSKLVTLKLAKITSDRELKLVKQKAVSKEEADKAEADYLSALADVQNIESQIAFKQVRAPFSGRIGIRNINLGEYFQNGDNAGTLTEITPVYVDFQVPQNSVGNINLGGKLQFTTDALPGKTFVAKIIAIDSYVDSSNRSVTVRATYSNKDKKVLPGMFVNVSVNLPTIKKAIIIQRNAISYNIYGQFVYVLVPQKNKDGSIKRASWTDLSKGQLSTVHSDKILYKAKQVEVKVLHTRKNLAVVTGIKAGDIIATSGQNKLQDGDYTIINNSVKLNNNILNTQGNT
ncbi:efflux RND transporter periplasmic adaptor subunit [Francisella uliginis]|uniref:Efflux transporter periplasmic adaptor subunit n=1 Tax=Francisella uliginis TaxID=573570 RepID=A0A1L4BQ92_9GAMM|nr:efflux RND transporter periplasmic adaptor subunit [Francisella uliginis]API86004.1 efflux transporter periplasmic adaptor subunit [Francisella uliginis]